jgi:putative transposase
MISDIYYHIYNRGAHKADIFLDGSDYVRMVKLLYIANNDEPFVMRELPENIFLIERRHPLIDIVAYCLMPNHVHIAVKKIAAREPGTRDNLTCFLHKLMTAYSTYFNIKYGHSGTIWQGACKGKTVDDGLYIRTLINYIHLNPCGIKGQGITKPASDEYGAEAVKFATDYEYSSLKDYAGIKRQQVSILSLEEMAKFRP